MLPTPAASDGRHGGPGQTRTQGGPPLAAVAHRLLPTPDAALALGGHTHRGGARAGEPLLPGVALSLLPTPTTQPTTGNGHARDLSGEVRLLPTPDATHGRRDTRTGPLLPGAVALLPTPAASEPGGTAQDYRRRLTEHDGRSGAFLPLGMLAQTLPSRWGPYADAVARWEAVTGREAPPATEPGAHGQPRLSARFVEWLMGLPAGHVTAVPGVSRSAQLKALGNGVVPQQAALAVTTMLADLPGGVLERLRAPAHTTP